MPDSILNLLGHLGSALIGGIVVAGAVALWHRQEIARIAESRRALQAQWRQIGELWTALDPGDRRAVRLTWTQRTLLALAVARAALAPITDALDNIAHPGGDRNDTTKEQAAQAE